MFKLNLYILKLSRFSKEKMLSLSNTRNQNGYIFRKTIWFRYIIFFVLGSLLLCCSEKEHLPDPIDRDLPKLKIEGKITALINYSATSYFIYKGEPMGFEYELLKKYAKSAQLELEVVPIKNMDSIFVDLNKGVGDVVAANLTVTLDRKQEVNFTHPVLITEQVLIQRKPDNWRKLSKKNWKDSLLKSPIDLANKTVVVRQGSSFYDRLKSLSEEIGGKITIQTVPGVLAMEQLIEQVANKEIDYTIADKNIAIVNEWQYPNIDASMSISSDQQIAFATRINSDSLILSINSWLKEYQKTKAFKMLYQKYYGNQKQFDKRINHDHYTLTSGQISSYDDLLKKYAQQIPWDWELLAALIYQQSHFNNDAIGWGNSFGLMQFMPETGMKFGVDSTSSAEQNIKAGVKYIKFLTKIWEDEINDSSEIQKFVLASYNTGPGHVLDASRLAKKYNKNPYLWKDVGYYLKNKSKPLFYKDEVVQHGYCKGYIAFDYVNEIMERYKHYQAIISEHTNKL